MTTATANTSEALRDAIREIYQGAGIGTPPRSSGRPPMRSGIVGVTSPWTSDGKTTIAMALASSLASDFDGSAILADADFSTRSIADEYGLSNSEGMAALLSGTADADDVQHSLPSARLSIIPAGSPNVDAERFVRSDAARQRLDELRERARFVVLDLPAVLMSATTPALAQYCDSVIVVARSGKTTTQDLERSVSLLSGCNVAGVVLNQWESRIPHWLEQTLGLQR